jgi:hypothetical protein
VKLKIWRTRHWSNVEETGPQAVITRKSHAKPDVAPRVMQRIDDAAIRGDKTRDTPKRPPRADFAKQKMTAAEVNPSQVATCDSLFCDK